MGNPMNSGNYFNFSLKTMTKRRYQNAFPLICTNDDTELVRQNTFTLVCAHNNKKLVRHNLSNSLWDDKITTNNDGNEENYNGSYILLRLTVFDTIEVRQNKIDCRFTEKLKLKFSIIL